MEVDLTKAAFYSGVNYLKRDASSGSANLALGAYGSTSTYTVTHGLGYIPFYQVFSEQDNIGKIWDAQILDTYTDTSLGGVDPPNPALNVWATTTTLVMKLVNSTNPIATGSRTIYWLIYRDYGS